MEFIVVKNSGSYRVENTLHLVYTNQSILYREIITVCSEINTEHTNILCEQNVEFLNVKPGGKLGLTKVFVISSFIRNVIYTQTCRIYVHKHKALAISTGNCLQR